MSRKRKPEPIPASVQLAYFTVAARLVQAAGFASRGGVFTPQEMTRMDEWMEKGRTAESFGEWVVQRRYLERLAEMALEGECMGDETVALSMVEVAA